jgi:hypothetical protein
MVGSLKSSIAAIGLWLRTFIAPGQEVINHEVIRLAFESAGFNQPDEDQALLACIAMDVRQFHGCGIAKSTR